VTGPASPGMLGPVSGPHVLADAAYFADPPPVPDAAARERLLQAGAGGLLLDGPTEVDLGARATWPVVGAAAEPLRERAGLPGFGAAGVAVAVDLERGDARVGLAVAPRPEPLRRPGPPAEDLDPGEGVGAASFALELRERLGIPWRPGEWAATVLLRDRASAPVRTRLVAPPPRAWRDPAVEAFLEAHRLTPYPRPVWPPAGEGVAYAPEAETPPLPDAGPGLALAADRVVELDAAGGGACRVWGRLRLPAPPRVRVRPPDPGSVPPTPSGPDDDPEADGYVWADVGDPAATAVLPVTLVVVGFRTPGPAVLRLQVPSTTPIDPGAESPLVEAAFRLDLLRRPACRSLVVDQTCAAWAFAGAHRAGPALAAVVPAGRLPG